MIKINLPSQVLKCTKKLISSQTLNYGSNYVSFQHVSLSLINKNVRSHIQQKWQYI